MDTYGHRLHLALASKARQKNISGAEARSWLAREIGISVQALSQVILGKTKSLTAINHELAVEALECSGAWLASGKGSMNQQYDKNPTTAYSYASDSVASYNVGSNDFVPEKIAIAAEKFESFFNKRTLKILAERLAKASEGRRDAVLALLKEYIKDPDDDMIARQIVELLSQHDSDD